MAIQIADELDLHGILAVEMFLMKDESIIVNELAPRPHNSGHWTLDYCEVSQFQNLINTIFLNSPKSPSPHASCKMINVIGDEFLSKEKLKKKFKFYDYFRKKSRVQEKWDITLLKFNIFLIYFLNYQTLKLHLFLYLEIF